MSQSNITTKQKFTIFGILVLTTIIAYVLFFPKKEFRMEDSSMETELYKRDPLSVDGNYGELSRGNVIIFEIVDEKGRKKIKTRRVIGKPNEEIHIKDGKIKIYKKNEKKTVTLDESNYMEEYIETYAGENGDATFETSESEYFVLGDNRIDSQDSRHWGNVSQEDIIGRVRGTKDYNALAD